ncbi:MAG: hypothetical protein ABIW31_04125 [Novosphingobium sp.]
MSTGRSHVEFLEFLDWLGTKGLLPTNTAHARKAVANKVLAALDPSELDDVTTLDIDQVMLRFTNKFGKRYTPDSLRTYRSRFESSITDFSSYCQNPVGFKLSGRTRLASQPNEKPESANTKKPLMRRRPPPAGASPVDAAETPRFSPSSVVPIQIRENLTISVGPIPFDFSAAEAKRVANVILALAVTV